MSLQSGRCKVLENMFQYKAHTLDRSTWGRCRAACKSVKQDIMDAQCKNTEIWNSVSPMHKHLDEAASKARELISPHVWTTEDPRCSSQHCCNKTGIWTPPHIIFPDDSPKTASIIENQWWRDKPCVRNYYPTYLQQRLLTITMDEWQSDYKDRFGVPIKRLYVVCSEECLHDVKVALDCIHWRNRLLPNASPICGEFEIFLGVHNLQLESESVSQSESSDETVWQLDGDSEQT